MKTRNETVYGAVGGPVNNQKTNEAVWGAAFWAVYGVVHDAADWAVRDAVSLAVGWAADRAVHDAVDEAVHEDPPHPALQDFLSEVGESQ